MSVKCPVPDSAKIAADQMELGSFEAMLRRSIGQIQFLAHRVRCGIIPWLGRYNQEPEEQENILGYLAREHEVKIKGVGWY